MTTFAQTFNVATPQTSDSPTEADDRMREEKAALQERLDVDHYFEKSGNTCDGTNVGKHRKVTFYGPLSADPTVAADELALYTKTVSAKSELFVADSDGHVKQVTSGGKLNISATDIADNLITQAMIQLAKDGWLVGLDTAGTADINLIKSDGASPILGNGAKTYSTAAPGQDQHVSNKKYVDDRDTVVTAALTIGTPVTTDSLGNALAQGSTYKATGGPGYVTLTYTGSVTGSKTYYYYDSATNPPTTIRGACTGPYQSVMFVVPSGWYWKTAWIAGDVIARIEWTPIGSATCVKQ